MCGANPRSGPPRRNRRRSVDRLGDKLSPLTSSNWRFIKADVNEYTDIAPVMISHQFDYVFHYAAVAGVQRTLDNQIKVLEDIDGFRNVLGLAKNTGVRRVFFPSSSEVYGEGVPAAA